MCGQMQVYLAEREFRIAESRLLRTPYPLTTRWRDSGVNSARFRWGEMRLEVHTYPMRSYSQ